MKAGKQLSDSRIILSGSIGNVLEWYDFALYGYFAKIIASQFFPDESKTAGLIAVFGVFAAGFLMRPIGAAIYGHIGDKVGRKRSLLLSVALMSVSTFFLGLLPTYAAIGVAAPILLTVIRLVQGLSVGGELTTSITFISEISPANKRGFYGSWTTVGAVSGILLGSAIGGLSEHIFSHEELVSWGWRIPFILGIVLGIVSLFLREKLREPESFLKLKEEENTSKSPLKEAFKLEWKNMLQNILVLWIFAVGFYMSFVYMPTYLNTEEGISFAISLDWNSAAMLVLVFLIMIMGYLSDLWGRKTILYFGIIGSIIYAYPMFSLLQQHTAMYYFLALLPIALFTGAIQGAMPAFMCESFQAKTRVTAMSVSYNVALALFGGTTPLIATYLIKVTSDKSAPAYYLIFAGVVSLISLFFMKRKLPDDIK